MKLLSCAAVTMSNTINKKAIGMFNHVGKTKFSSVAQAAMLSLLLVAGLSTSLFAQAGKIKATIVDSKTGEALIRASVQVLETKQGTYTKADGTGTIINIAPGENYTIVAKYAGYEAQTLKNVRVKADITTELKFKLSTKAGDTIFVEAKQLVEKTKTDIGGNVSGTEIKTTVRQNVDAVVALQKGIVRDGSNGGFAVHGSRGTSNNTQYNGVAINDVVNGSTSILQTAVSTLGVSEVNITTGGADASKGNSTGGTINTNTKGGGLDLEFSAHYRGEIAGLFGSSGNGYKQLGAGERIMEAALGGPLFTDDIKFFITGKTTSRDFRNAPTSGSGSNLGLNVIDPYGNTTGQLDHTKYFSRAYTSKINFDALGLHLTADALLSSVSAQVSGTTLAYMDQAELPAANSIDNLFSLRGNTAIGEGGIVEFTVGYNHARDSYGKYDQAAGGGLFTPYKIYESLDQWTYNDNDHSVQAGGDGIVDIYTPVSRQIPDPKNPANVLNLSGAGLNPFTGHVEGPPITFSTANPYGLLNSYIAAGNVGGFYNNSTNQIQFDTKYTNQFDNHLINVGAEAHLYNITNFSNNLPWDANPFKDSFAVKPLLAAVYLIDKMEFADITFNPSLRFDIYSPGNDHALVDPNNPTKIVNGITVPNFTTAPVQTQLSPRLGITYAVTEKTMFNFNYGLYFKQPLFGEVLTNTGGNLLQVLQRGNQIIGNGSLKAEHTQEFNVGFTSAVSDQVVLSVNGIYKDMRNLSGLQRVSNDNLAIGYTVYSDDQYGNYRGLELSLEKRMSDNYSFRVNYTYSVAKGTSSSSAENYGLLINQGTSSGDEPNVVLPLTPFYLGFDRTHVAQFLLTAGFGPNEGPQIFGTKLLQDLMFSSVSEFQSGTPFTRLDEKGRQAGEFNGDRQPSYFQTDATLTRTIRLADIFGESIGHGSFDIQLEVQNLFNTTNPLFVYATSGQADNDGLNPLYLGTLDFINDPTNADGGQLDALGKLKYNPRWDLNSDGRVSIQEQGEAYKQLRSDNFARRTNYQVPRRVYFNFTVHF